MAVYGSLSFAFDFSAVRENSYRRELERKIATHQVGVFRFESPVDSDAELVLGVTERRTKPERLQEV